MISQRLDVCTGDQTLQGLRTLDPSKQKKMATTICRLIFHSGFMDAHFNNIVLTKEGQNIVLTKEGQLAVVDTEGQGLLHDATEAYSPTPLGKNHRPKGTNRKIRKRVAGVR